MLMDKFVDLRTCPLVVFSDNLLESEISSGVVPCSGNAKLRNASAVREHPSTVIP